MALALTASQLAARLRVTERTARREIARAVAAQDDPDTLRVVTVPNPGRGPREVLAVLWPSA
jgi:hypothetical protein